MGKYLIALLALFVSVNMASAQGVAKSKLSQDDFRLVKTHTADHMNFTDLIRRIEILEAENKRLRKNRDPNRNKGWWYDGNTNSWHRYTQTSGLDNPQPFGYTYSYPVMQYAAPTQMMPFYSGNGGGGGCPT